MRPGANALDVIDHVKQRLDGVWQGLLDGVELKIVYDRSALIEGAAGYLTHKLIEKVLCCADRVCFTTCPQCAGGHYYHSAGFWRPLSS